MDSINYLPIPSSSVVAGFKTKAGQIVRYRCVTNKKNPKHTFTGNFSVIDNESEWSGTAQAGERATIIRHGTFGDSVFNVTSDFLADKN